MGLVVVLNGASSVGKSSVAGAVQDLAARDVLLVAMDAFLGMLPRRSFGTEAGLTFVDMGDAGLEVRSGPLVDRALDAMRRTAAALASTGGTVIVDDVMLGAGDEDAYRALLSDHEFRLVGLHAPLGVVTQRERQRGDRAIGLARWQIGRVHRGRRYDLELDTSTMTPLAAARRICDAFEL